MPISRIKTAGPALFAVLVTALVLPAIASASTGVHIRVVTQDGRDLADVIQYTDSLDVPTSPQATCFDSTPPLKGGSGKPFPVRGATALGAAVDASQFVSALQPVLVTDEFSFGLGVCGFGGANADSSDFWQIRVNHVALQVASNDSVLGDGDDVLWALVPNPVCPPPDFNCQPTEPELTLDAPATASPGVPFPVKATEYSDTGNAKPAAGVTVTGAAAPTDASGATMATLSSSGDVVAARSGSIPSPELAVCVNASQKKCPAARGTSIFGSPGDDSIGGTPGPDTIKAGDGDDVIRVRGGGTDTVDCGAGNDIVKVDRSDKVNKRDCEQVLRPHKRKRHRRKGHRT